VAFAATVSLSGVETRLDTTAIGQAVSLGQTSFASDLVRFHQAYRVAVAVPPFDYVEIVTPFRRIVLAAQSRARAGDRRFGQREAQQITADTAGQIEIFGELTFHPLNTYVLVPAYAVRLTSGASDVVLPRNVDSTPRYGPRVEGSLVPYAAGPLPGGALPGRAQPMQGATVRAVFDAEAIGRRCDRGCSVVFEERSKEPIRIPIALGSVR
jgi:hypothetical protein